METLIRDCLVILGTTIVISILFFIRTKKKILMGPITGIVLFVMSMTVIFNLTGVSPISGFHTDIHLREISIIPIKGIIDMIEESFTVAVQGNASLGEDIFYVAENIIGNILLFAPLGFFLPLLLNKFRKFKKTVLAGFLVSLLIECSQLFLIRATDIDDLILNTLGVMLGYLCFMFFRKLLPKINQKFILDKEGNNSIWAYMPYICIFIPYIVTIVLGFYDRGMLGRFK